MIPVNMKQGNENGKGAVYGKKGPMMAWQTRSM